MKNRADSAENRAQKSDVTKTSPKSNSVSFQGIHNTILRKTMNNIDEIYTLYKTSLEEVSMKYIIESVDNIKKDTGHSKKDILFAMQQLTNFSNIRSVKTIANTLERDNISSICNNKRVFCEEDFSKRAVDIMNENFDLHRTLEYMIEYKGFGNLDKCGSKRTAFFLNNKNIELLERLKEECPDDFIKLIKNKDMKFYYLSGWDRGITFIDRTKKIEKQTRQLIATADKTGAPVNIAADAPFLKRIHQLGISPKIISREGLPTEVCIYNRLAPEKMTKAELTNLIIANSMKRSKDVNQRLVNQDRTAEYINNNLKVFTPESLSSLSSILNVKVNNFAKEKGIKPENILYVDYNIAKSNSLINYMYKMVNNISDEKFITFSELKKKDEKFLDKKLLVFLDDCTITGNSINDIIYMYLNDISKDVPKLFACYGATANAQRALNNAKNKEMNIHLIIGDYIPHVLTNIFRVSDKKIGTVVGRPNYVKGEATCLSFPYMSPDTNTELAANIALLHNANYRLSNTMVPYKKRNFRYSVNNQNAFETSKLYKHNGVKNYTSLADEIARQTNKLSGSTPAVIEKNPVIERESFLDKIYNYIFCKK